MTAIGVLCARARVEEKQIIAALVEAGAVASPVPPASTPLPPGPASAAPSMLDDLVDPRTGEAIAEQVTTIIDRAVNRAVPMAVLPMLRTLGVRTIDAGLASTGTRLQVAGALAAAGIPRPACLVGFSEETGMVAANRIGFPSTLLGLLPGETTTPLQDQDTADAVIEHRVVLGQDAEAIMLIQDGAPTPQQRTIVHVIGGRAIAWSGAQCDSAEFALAERAAAVLEAAMVAVELADVGEGMVVWDVLPVGDFRGANLIAETTVAAAIAALCDLAPAPASAHAEAGGKTANGWERGVQRGYALTA